MAAAAVREDSTALILLRNLLDALDTDWEEIVVVVLLLFDEAEAV